MIDQDPVPVVHNGGRRLSFLEAHSCCSPPVRGIVRPERLRYREHMSETEFNNPPAPESESALESESARESEPTPEIDSMSSPTPTQPNYLSSPALTVAIVWACLAVIFAIVLLTNATDESYEGDAYTGIQNAVAWAVRGIAFLLFGSGALGIVIALRRDRS
jgi:hypothetical protein